MEGYSKNENASHYNFRKGLINYDELRNKGLSWYPSDFIEEHSSVALENDELEIVLNQIQKENLIDACKRYLDFWNKEKKMLVLKIIILMILKHMKIKMQLLFIQKAKLI